MDVIYPGGASEHCDYDGNNRVTSLENKKGDGSLIDSYSYTYDAAGNQKTKTDSSGLTFNYYYDSLNRLLKVLEPGRETFYSYDAAGNRMTENVISGSETSATTYQYNDQNRLTASETVTSQQTEKTAYFYDNNGNLYSKVKSITSLKPAQPGIKDLPQFDLIRKGEATDKNTTFYTYDNRNRMIKLVEGSDTSTFVYNAEGYRVEKTVNGKTTKYLYEADKVIIETDDSSNILARNFYGANLIARETGGELLYYMYNAHGDVTALLGSGEELLTDGSFSTKDYKWYTWAANGAIATGKRDTSNYDTYPAGYKIDCVSSGSDNCDLQFVDSINNRLKITAGKTYRLTFKAKSVGGNTTTYIGLHKEGTPWTPYATYVEVTIGGEWDAYSVDFTANTSDDVARLTFYLGGRMPDNSALYIDSISFREESAVSAVVARYDYDAFGNIIRLTGNEDNSITYAGYQFDWESGLYYINSRYYDSKTARFITEDVLRGQAGDPLSLNVYTYCVNNPLIYWDPSGNIPEGLDDQIGGTLGDQIVESNAEWNYWNNLMYSFVGAYIDPWALKQIKSARDKQDPVADAIRFQYAIANSGYSNTKYGFDVNYVNDTNNLIWGVNIHSFDDFIRNKNKAIQVNTVGFDDNKKLEYYLDKLKFTIDNGIDGTLKVESSSALIVSQWFFGEEDKNGNNLMVTGTVDKKTITLLQSMALVGLSSENIMAYADMYYEKCEKPLIDNTQKSIKAKNGNFNTSNGDFVRIPSQLGGDVYLEKKTAIAWSFLVQAAIDYNSGDTSKYGVLDIDKFAAQGDRSAYRTVQQQKDMQNEWKAKLTNAQIGTKYGNIVDSYMKKYKVSKAQAVVALLPGYAAPPGTSNHGYGLALDMTISDSDKGGGFEQWLRANCDKYGFTPYLDKDSGYKDYKEIWHYDYMK